MCLRWNRWRMERTSYSAAPGAERVSFSYGGAPVLRDVSLSFPEGAVVGIVGRSGCGKSTLLKLLMRFWDADSGTVRISGEDIRTVNTASLRGAESFVVQDTQLFHDSIENNVKLAKLSATHEEVVQACKKAAVHDFIMTLPQGYATPVGELGETLSGRRAPAPWPCARLFCTTRPLYCWMSPPATLTA